MKLLGRLWRLLALLALPLLTVALLLYFGRPEYTPSAVGPAPAPLEVQVPAPLRGWQLKFADAEGRPADRAVVLVSEPSARYAEADAEGIVQLELPVDAELAFFAAAPGMETLRWGPAADPPSGVLTFAPLPEAPPPAEGVVRLPAELQLRSVSGEALDGALVLARRVDRPREAPWIGISDASGTLQFLGLPDSTLELQIYAPGMPPVPATLLATRRIEPAADAIPPVVVEAAWLEVGGLPVDAVAALSRLGYDDALPRRMVPVDGVLRLGPLPPGDYHLDVAGVGSDLLLEPGRRASR